MIKNKYLDSIVLKFIGIVMQKIRKTVRLEKCYLDYISTIMKEHGDYNFSNCLRKVLNGSMFLLENNIDICNINDVRVLIDKYNDKKN